MEPDNHRDQPPRPQPVTIALYFIYTGILLGIPYMIINAATTWQESAEYYTNSRFFICFGLSYLLSIFVAVKIGQGRNWARILYLIGFLLTLFDIAFNFRNYFNFLPQSTIVAAQRFLELSALVLLYQAPSSAWFKAEKISSKEQLAGDVEATYNDHSKGSAAGDVEEVPSAPRDPDMPVTKLVTISAAIGAVIALLNPVFWTLSLSPLQADGREFIYFQMIGGFLLGASLGAVFGYLFYHQARRNPKRAPLRWAVLGAVLGGLLAFGSFFCLAAVALI